MNETYKNYFSLKSAAERYDKGRPRFHSFVIGKIKKFLALENSFELALDVGCGTGLSSIALKEISEKVVGIDISAGMLNQAKKTDDIQYVLASAENLPLCTGKFDLITISQAVHWVDKEKLFAEADRVLKPESLLIAYDNYFQGQMLGNPAFTDWYKEEFLDEFPVPPRGARAFVATSVNAQDFILKHEEFNENTLEFSAEEMVNYLVTISNVIARVENGAQPIEEVYDRLTESIKPFFNETRRKFAFINPIWYLQRNS
ncbi:MAG: class I SAM-dependent methyltransferase [Actinomycetota bacterium]